MNEITPQKDSKLLADSLSSSYGLVSHRLLGRINNYVSWILYPQLGRHVLQITSIQKFAGLGWSNQTVAALGNIYPNGWLSNILACSLSPIYDGIMMHKMPYGAVSDEQYYSLHLHSWCVLKR
jgi:hypothetical protein